MLIVVDITILESLLKTEAFLCVVLYTKKEASNKKFPFEKKNLQRMRSKKVRESKYICPRS